MTNYATLWTGDTATPNSTAVVFFPPVGATYAPVNESGQVTLRITDTLTWGNLCAQLSTNSLASGAGLTSRINRANGNQILSIAPATTGIFEDTSNTDAIVSGNDINYKWVGSGSTGSTVMNYISSTLADSTANTTMYWGETATPSVGPTYGGSLTYYGPLNGANILVSGEPQASTTLQFAGTWSFLGADLVSNTLSGTSTIKSRLAGANGNQVLSIGPNATGFFIDTSDTDTITAGGSGLCYQLATPSAAGISGTLAMKIGPFSKCVTTSGQYHTSNCNASGGTSVSINQKWYGSYGGDTTGIQLTETKEQRPVRGNTLTGKNMFVNVVANTLTLSVTAVNSRKNTAAGSLSASIADLTTGIFVDNSNSDSYALGDKINYQISTSNVGVGSLIVGMVGITLVNPAAVTSSFFQHSGPLRLRRFNR